MCIIIVAPDGKKVPKEHLQQSSTKNSDGMGFMYVRDREHVVVKQMEDFDAFYEKYKAAHEANPISTFIFHFRIKTHGEANIDNCHPFKVSDNVWFCHNGIIGGTCYKGMSDTRTYGIDVLEKLPKNFYTNKAILKLVEKDIGFSSKFAFLSKYGKYYLVNEEKGHWLDGIWYSNKSYEKPTPIRHISPTYGFDYGAGYDSYYDGGAWVPREGLGQTKISTYKKPEQIDNYQLAIPDRKACTRAQCKNSLTSPIEKHTGLCKGDLIDMLSVTGLIMMSEELVEVLTLSSKGDAIDTNVSLVADLELMIKELKDKEGEKEALIEPKKA